MEVMLSGPQFRKALAGFGVSNHDSWEYVIEKCGLQKEDWKYTGVERKSGKGVVREVTVRPDAIAKAKAHIANSLERKASIAERTRDKPSNSNGRIARYADLYWTVVKVQEDVMEILEWVRALSEELNCKPNGKGKDSEIANPQRQF